MNESCCTYEWVMSHIWMWLWHEQVKTAWKLKATCECGMSHIWMSHVSYMNESCCSCECSMSHMRMSRIICQTYEWVMSEMFEWERHERRVSEEGLKARGNMYTSHAWMSHVSHMCMCHAWVKRGWKLMATCKCRTWVMSHPWMSHVARLNESRHTHEWVMSHVWMRRVSHMWMCHAWVKRNESSRRLYTSHVARINESWHTYEWVMSHVRMSHVIFHTYERVMSHTRECVINEWREIESSR